jgi:hypothetical protein
LRKLGVVVADAFRCSPASGLARGVSQWILGHKSMFSPQLRWPIFVIIASLLKFGVCLGMAERAAFVWQRVELGAGLGWSGLV